MTSKTGAKVDFSLSSRDFRYSGFTARLDGITSTLSTSGLTVYFIQTTNNVRLKIITTQCSRKRPHDFSEQSRLFMFLVRLG